MQHAGGVSRGQGSTPASARMDNGALLAISDFDIGNHCLRIGGKIADEWKRASRKNKKAALLDTEPPLLYNSVVR